MRATSGVVLITCISLVLLILPRLSHASPGNAEVRRTRNLQYFQSSPSNADALRLRNLQYFELAPNDADVVRLRNTQYFQMQPNDADVVRLRNTQYFQMQPNDADVVRIRNLQYFELESLEDWVINIGSIVTTDIDGVAKTNFTLGETVQFEFVVENAGNLSLVRGLVSSLILDPLDTPVSIAYAIEDLMSGEIRKFVWGSRIMPDWSIGTYTIKATVYTDWPSHDGIGLAAQSVTFTVS